MSRRRARPRSGEGVFRRLKRRSGYYEARRKRLRGPFARALRPTDAFLVGHPKSGNTWVAYMLAVLLRPDSRDAITLANVSEYVPFVHGRDDRIAKYGRLPDPRLFRNEDPQYPDLYPRIIYLVRDPRAALVSLWHMYRTMFDVSEPGLDSFLEQYLASGGIFEWWNSKVTRWDLQVGEALDRAERDQHVHVLSYEDLIGDREGCIRALGDFLRIGVTEEDVVETVGRGAFSAMREVEEAHGAEAYRDRAAGEGRFVRVGRVDAWREELTRSQEKRIVDALGPVMSRAGYL